MENIDVMVLRTLRDWRAAGKRALLATVVRTWGSSPRPVGSIMALAEDGAVVGSVSGGCIEDDLIYRHTRAYAGTEPGHQIPSGAPASSSTACRRRGAPLRPALRRHAGTAAGVRPRPRGARRTGARTGRWRLMRRTVRLADGAVTLADAPAPEELSLQDGQLVNVFGPEYRMLMIGAGQLTEYLATMALFSGFAVTVCDPREEYRGAWSVPGAKVVSDMPDDVVATFRPDRRSCVVALTHDPKLDDLALMEALKTEAFYVGAIGSRRNNEARHQRMIEHFGLSAADLQRLRGPIGVYIGSKTPARSR
jgi:xanthine dehydrogenase accessory factor